MTPQNSTAKIRIALVFGGRSGEHDVSVVSARSVDRAFDRDRYHVVPMGIDRRGLWADPETARRVLTESTDRTDGIVPFEGRDRIDPRLTDGSIDVAFPVLHGPYGEDGTIQGLFEMLDLPYVGCDVASSALCMDKIFCKARLAQAGLQTPAWRELDETLWKDDRKGALERCLELSLPLFVKPARLGSSLGISKVKQEHELAAAIEKALGHGQRIVVEEGIDGREIEIAVLGNRRPRASVPGEVRPGREFYDFDDKYLDSTCELLAPAPLDEATTKQAQDLAVRVFSLLGCSGMARVDLFLQRESGALMVSEVNTIPGFTAISLYPRLWDLAGLGYPALVNQLIDFALER